MTILSTTPSIGRRVQGRYLGIALFLALLLPLTWALKAWRVADIRADLQERQDAAVSEALAYIEADFSAMQAELLAEAKRVAALPEVVEGLRAHQQRAGGHGTEGLVEQIAALPLLEQGSVGVYDNTPRIVAWKGFDMPLDDAVNKVRFLQTFQTAVAHDGDLRRALVVWWPVREQGRALGAVRAMRRITFRAPLQNRYLRDYSLDDLWQRATGLSVRVTYTAPMAEVSATQGHAWVLQGADGTVLGRVLVQPPTEEQLVQTTAGRFNDVLAFWSLLLALWGLGGLWAWYRSSLAGPPGETVHAALRRAAGRFTVLAAAWWGLRYLLLALDVPARWQAGKAPLSPLFDPTHLASTYGAGLLRSTGDLLLTALFALAFAVAFLELAAAFREKERDLYRLRVRLQDRPSGNASPLGFGLTAVLSVLLPGGLALLLAAVTRHAVLDSTLDYFARSGLLPEQPERLTLIVFCALLLVTLAVVLLIVGLMWIALWFLVRYRPARWPFASFALAPLGVALVLVPALYLLFDLQRVLPWLSAAAFILVGFLAAYAAVLQQWGRRELLTLRGILLFIFLLTVLLYPAFYKGMNTKQRIQMMDAAETLDEGGDPRIDYALRQVLEEARTEEGLPRLFRQPHSAAVNNHLDSLARELLRGSLLASLGPYDVRVTFFDSTGVPVGRYFEVGQALGPVAVNLIDSTEFDILRQMYEEGGENAVLVQQVTGRLERDRFQYVGIAPVAAGEEARPGWVMALAEPQSLFDQNETPFPRVLLPTGLSGNLRTNLSLASFRNGVLERSLGRDFGRYKLSKAVEQDLLTQEQLWSREAVEGRRFLTYYRRQEARAVPESPAALTAAASPLVSAVRAPAINTFDHLYYLLRLTVAGLFIGLPFYLFGLYLRWHAGQLPSTRVRFRDKVLNAFLGVGIISIAAVGFVGREVVTEETEGAVRSWLRQHLERVERVLALRAVGEEMPYRVLERVSVDSLAALTGLDLNIYKDAVLVASSRPQLVRDRLIDARLPAEAYATLYFDGYRLTYTDEQVGTFSYKAGYRALLDEQGRPRYVIGIPTLPEQERIEEERARTTAYLFGALLVLVLVVMLTAALLANALARPIGRLRSGLEAVARGQFERAIPVSTRDEIGELVETFNVMQQQLAESRRILAQQERQLAWREMARQVAHEIKNPLTPMKLSVQHLRRAYDNLDLAQKGAILEGKFGSLFERITTTLIEQIDTLARIANEFHSFARLPTRLLERLDLNVVVQEAVALMQEEAGAEITLDLHGEPLVVEADREELRRVYINLIKNALQAVPDSRESRVRVSTTREADPEGLRPWASSTVGDNGIGVPPELQGRIFEPNFSTKTSGTGLGLAIVRKSVEDLHGEIGFRTEEDVGTAFTVRLPLVED